MPIFSFFGLRSPKLTRIFAFFRLRSPKLTRIFALEEFFWKKNFFGFCGPKIAKFWDFWSFFALFYPQNPEKKMFSKKNSSRASRCWVEDRELGPFLGKTDHLVIFRTKNVFFMHFSYIFPYTFSDNCRNHANFGGIYLNNEKRFFNSVKSSWKCTTYSFRNIKNLIFVRDAPYRLNITTGLNNRKIWKIFTRFSMLPNVNTLYILETK